jgi:methyltransferase (TIGR00027 family)
MQIMDFAENGGKELVLLGAGYDMRPFRLSFPAGMRVYELDFPAVLVDRQQRLDQFGVKDPPGVRRIQVPTDLRVTTLSSALSEMIDFSVPVFVAWEGMSMYFEEPEVRSILRGILPVLQNTDSRLWVDFVSEQAISNPQIFSEVAAFMEGMQMLGEPFIFGTRSVEAFMRSNGFQCREVVGSDAFTEKEDPVYSIYSFCLASPDGTLLITEDQQDAVSWIAHGAHPGRESVVSQESSAVRKDGQNANTRITPK